MARELLPRPVRIAIGATNVGVGDRRLRKAVDGKVVIVTGASSGIGEALARRLARNGAIVLMAARSADKLEQMASEIASEGGRASAIPTDMANMEQVEALAQRALDEHGHVDVIVSNAGLSIRRWISESYDRFHDIERTNAVNYLGPARLMMSLLPSMRERRSGHIVNVATMGVGQPPIGWTAYIASKNALETWLRGVAPEIRADGVTTTSVHFQLVRSPMLGPFKAWRYIPGMSTEEAAGMIGRAIVDKPRLISPHWARATAPLNVLAQAPIERALAVYARFGNPDSRPAETPPVIRRLEQAADAADEAVGGLLTIAASRTVRPHRPDRLARAGLAWTRYGFSLASPAAAAAALYPDRKAVIDEDGAMTFAEHDAQARALAGALYHHFDVRSGQKVAIMSRNHRGFVVASVAAGRLGCDLVLLNYDYAAPQLAEVFEREGATAALLDSEFQELFEQAGIEGTRVLIDEPRDEAALPTLQSLVTLGAAEAPAPREHGKPVLMTSGTTGTPKGVSRGSVAVGGLVPVALGGLPALAKFKPTPRSGKAFVVAPPLFHAFGFVVALLAFVYGSPVVLRRRFDPEQTLALVDETKAETLFVVPTMIKRVMDLPAADRERHDTSSLRMVVSGASGLPPELATAFMDEFGDILYNGYSSTELGAGTIATPRDLRAAPGTVGRAPHGIDVKILDEEGVELPPGQTGRIFVGGPFHFEGYTGGDQGRKDIIDGCMRSGDVGHMDEAGRLFIDGRDDDMIVSGGENVFPQEVEEFLLTHDAVADAGVIGVPDDDFGQRLAAYVVLKEGASVTEDELRGHVGVGLARYKVPRSVEFVTELPRTSTGKLQRRKLVG